ncbi:MAG TPA: hypothetical protein VG389_06300 [Myxococcota bacterium]|nr:hypothetical protein [Myxococcota bacterium]
MRRTGLVGALVLAGSLAGCFATDPSGVKVEETGAFIVEGSGRLTDITFDQSSGHVLALDGLQLTEVTPAGDWVASYDLTAPMSATGFGTTTFEAVGTTPDGEVLLTSIDANGWRLSRATLALDWYFCLDAPDQPHGVETWSNGGVAVDEAGLAIYTMPSMTRDNTILTSSLEHYDMLTGAPLQEADLADAGVRSTGVAFVAERGTLLVAERDALLEMTTEGHILSSHAVHGGAIAGVAYDPTGGTVFLVDDADARHVSVNRIEHW